MRELQRALQRGDRALKKDLRDRLKDAAEPVAHDAAALAVSEIRNVRSGDRWSMMRVGVTQRLVYVAPKQRGVRGRGGKRRPNLADLMMTRAMEPALEQNRAQVEHKLEQLIDDIADDWNRGH